MVIFPQSIIVGEKFVARFPDRGYTALTVFVRGAGYADLTAEKIGDGWNVLVDSSNWFVRNDEPTARAAMEAHASLADGTVKVIAYESFDVRATIKNRQQHAEGTSVPGEDVDTRSLAERNVDALEAYLSSIGDPNSDASVQSYKINNRELANYRISEVQKLLGYWRRRLVREQRQAEGARHL